jgi:hypothetical protein
LMPAVDVSVDDLCITGRLAPYRYKCFGIGMFAVLRIVRGDVTPGHQFVFTFVVRC